jgi:hypothetical protein
MNLEAQVHHHLPGRVRLRVPAAKGNEQQLRELGSAIARTQGITKVEYNSVLGSLLIQYSPALYRDLESFEAGLTASAVPIVVNNVSPAGHSPYQRQYRRGRSLAARKIDSFFKQLDFDIREATDNEVDLKFILPFAVAVLGLVALRYSSVTPLWLTLLIFAFNSFLGLHAPSIGELESLIDAEG